MTRDREMRLQQLVGRLSEARLLNAADVPIGGITNDSRRTAPGDLFIAIRGTQVDGHRFIPQALERGAAALVCEDPPSPLPECPVVQVADGRRAVSALADAFYGSPSRDLTVAGITGTDGKTSTTEILRAILNEAGHPAGSVGTLGCWIDGRRLDVGLTTPDAIALHDMLGRMHRVGLTHACMEVSSHSLIQRRVADVDFDAAVLTNITRDHLDTHGTRENYARAKRMLFEQLKPDAVAVLPAGGEFTESFRTHTRAEVLTYGPPGLADVSGRVLDQSMRGMEMLVQTPFDACCFRTRLIGSYNCLNILAATTVAFACGIRMAVVKEALRTFPGVPGRLEKVGVAGRTDLPRVAVDYAHTPEALDKVLATLRPLVKGKLVCVVGCGGDRDTTKRPIMGSIAAREADIAVFTADNSRSERTEDIIDQMLGGVETPGRNCRVEPDRRRAIELAIKVAATPDSMVLVAGRGCEQFQKLGDRRIPFDDRIVTRQILDGIPSQQKKSA